MQDLQATLDNIKHKDSDMDTKFKDLLSRNEVYRQENVSLNQ